MLNFDISKARFDYVQVSKITSQSIYVVGDRNGQEYVSIAAPRSNHNGRLVRKVKVNERVARGYFVYNALKEFSTPRLACLFVYDGEVLGIELQRFNYHLGSFEDAQSWVCYAERCMDRLARIIENKDDVFINGTEVYWPARDADGELYGKSQLDASGNFHLCFVDYVRLNRIGIGSYIRKENKLIKGRLAGSQAPEQGSVPDAAVEAATDVAEPAVIQEDNMEAMLVVQTGTVLRFTASDGSIAYSPVLKNDLKIGNAQVNESEILRPFFHADSIMKPNLRFIKVAGGVIGGIYGMGAVDFLNIPGIIEKTGEVCLFNIEEHHAKNICIDMDARTALAWLLGFLGKETRLNEMHSLNRMFRSLMKSGFAKMADTVQLDVTKDGHVAELPLLKFKSREERLLDIKAKQEKLEAERNKKPFHQSLRNGQTEEQNEAVAV